MENIVLRKPKGAAAEYAQRSFSAYKRCPNHCSYCYLNRAPLNKEFGTGVPELRKRFKDDDSVVERFRLEVANERETLIKGGGIFFSFITDPCLPQTLSLTKRCALIAIEQGVPVTILTKMAEWVHDEVNRDFITKCSASGLVCFGFTLTGRDDMEPFADNNIKRILAMDMLHHAGIKTLASIEPIIQFNKSMGMIRDTIGFCDIYKIGLMSGCKKDYYDDENLLKFMEGLRELHKSYGITMYIKDSIRERLGDDYLASFPCVGSDYNIFKR